MGADLSQPEKIPRLVEEVRRVLGPVDILINNATISWFMPILEMPDSKIRKTFEVNVFAPLALSRAVAPDMIAAGGGHICNLSSPGARHPDGPPYEALPVTAYGMCKQAVERMTTGLASEWYSHGIRVNCTWPTRLVLTPGAEMWGWGDRVPADQRESPDTICSAILALCGAMGEAPTGRLASSQDLLDDLGLSTAG